MIKPLLSLQKPLRAEGLTGSLDEVCVNQSIWALQLPNVPSLPKVFSMSDMITSLKERISNSWSTLDLVFFFCNNFKCLGSLRSFLLNSSGRFCLLVCGSTSLWTSSLYGLNDFCLSCFDTQTYLWGFYLFIYLFISHIFELLNMFSQKKTNPAICHIRKTEKHWGTIFQWQF